MAAILVCSCLVQPLVQPCDLLLKGFIVLLQLCILLRQPGHLLLQLCIAGPTGACCRSDLHRDLQHLLGRAWGQRAWLHVLHSYTVFSRAALNDAASIGVHAFGL